MHFTAKKYSTNCDQIETGPQDKHYLLFKEELSKSYRFDPVKSYVRLVHIYIIANVKNYRINT